MTRFANHHLQCFLGSIAVLLYVSKRFAAASIISFQHCANRSAPCVRAPALNIQFSAECTVLSRLMTLSLRRCAVYRAHFLCYRNARGCRFLVSSTRTAYRQHFVVHERAALIENTANDMWMRARFHSAIFLIKVLLNSILAWLARYACLKLVCLFNKVQQPIESIA